MSTSASANESESKKVTLKSCDDVEFKVEIPVASRSILLKNMIEGSRFKNEHLQTHTRRRNRKLPSYYLLFNIVYAFTRFVVSYIL